MVVAKGAPRGWGLDVDGISETGPRALLEIKDWG